MKILDSEPRRRARPEEVVAASQAVTRGVLEARLAKTFEAASPAPDNGELRAAAVAVVVCEHADELGVLLTMRARGMSRHASQFALPGGRLDAGETHEDAALRELAEELAIELGSDSVAGHMPGYDTRSGFRLRPIVVWAAELGTVRPAPDEVAEVFHVPLAALADPAVPILRKLEGLEKPLIQLPLGDELIHAPTGAILYQFIQAVVAERYVDAARFEEPRFAWK